MSGGREARRRRSVESTGDVGRREGKLQLVFCCNARDEIGIGKESFSSSLSFVEEGPQN